MNKIIILILSALLLTGCCAAEKGSSYEQISQDEAAEIIASGGDMIILDVRRPDEFASGHIPGAVNIPNETISRDDIPQLPVKDQLILVYCRSGNRSKQASGKLAALGYTNIKEFGGINTWSGDITAD